jgi:hypothetical protein
MKQKINISNIALFFVLIMLTSCDDFLNKEPISEVPVEQMWQTRRDVQAGVNNIYVNFRNTMRSNFFRWGELRADNFESKYGTADEPDMLARNQLTSSMASTLWTDLYATINAANAAIAHIHEADVPDESEKNDFIGQAYAMRALSYFYAVRVWGDVPVYLEPTENYSTIQFSTRINKTKVLTDVVIPDLKKALELISVNNKERKRLSKYATYAILADVYLWLGEWEKVNQTIDLFNTATGGTYLQFETDISKVKQYLSVDLNNKKPDKDYTKDEYGSIKEIIFVVHFDIQEYPTGSYIWSLFGGGGSGIDNGPGSVKLTEEFVSLFSSGNNRSGDKRKEYFVNTGGSSLLKYIPNGSEVSSTQWNQCEMAYPVYRTTELYFMKAEALARMSRWSDALAIVNGDIRKRAAGGILTSDIYTKSKAITDFASVEDLVDYILEEKRIDMVGEGKRWFDLVRTGRWTKLSKIKNADQTLFPIHYSHIEENKDFITQNNGY